MSLLRQTKVLNLEGFKVKDEFKKGHFKGCELSPTAQIYRVIGNITKDHTITNCIVSFNGEDFHFCKCKKEKM